MFGAHLEDSKAEGDMEPSKVSFTYILEVDAESGLGVSVLLHKGLFTWASSDYLRAQGLSSKGKC